MPIGQAIVRREGDDLTVVGVGVGVHRAMEAADALENRGVSAGVIDLRTVSPLDKPCARPWARPAVCWLWMKIMRVLGFLAN